ncbi:hypothetical protein BD311DRAFT_836711 [Dichomitus squalens]|uniref:Uncharacterized protein n=1 Tax=Dichomitus squalens TaxID=114155 RepID=A0A4Q9MSF4_9APHY|nr:hypothetical protein BD311DRAFT_836711 [Dichomitus squalens]
MLLPGEVSAARGTTGALITGITSMPVVTHPFSPTNAGPVMVPAKRTNFVIKYEGRRTSSFGARKLSPRGPMHIVRGQQSLHILLCISSSILPAVTAWRVSALSQLVHRRTWYPYPSAPPQGKTANTRWFTSRAPVPASLAQAIVGLRLGTKLSPLSPSGWYHDQLPEMLSRGELPWTHSLRAANVRERGRRANAEAPDSLSQGDRCRLINYLLNSPKAHQTAPPNPVHLLSEGPSLPARLQGSQDSFRIILLKISGCHISTQQGFLSGDQRGGPHRMGKPLGHSEREAFPPRTTASTSIAILLINNSGVRTWLEPRDSMGHLRVSIPFVRLPSLNEDEDEQLTTPLSSRPPYGKMWHLRRNLNRSTCAWLTEQCRVSLEIGQELVDGHRRYRLVVPGRRIVVPVDAVNVVLVLAQRFLVVVLFVERKELDEVFVLCLFRCRSSVRLRSGSTAILESSGCAEGENPSRAASAYSDPPSWAAASLVFVRVPDCAARLSGVIAVSSAPFPPFRASVTDVSNAPPWTHRAAAIDTTPLGPAAQRGRTTAVLSGSTEHELMDRLAQHRPVNHQSRLTNARASSSATRLVRTSRRMRMVRRADSAHTGGTPGSGALVVGRWDCCVARDVQAAGRAAIFSIPYQDRFRLCCTLVGPEEEKKKGWKAAYEERFCGQEAAREEDELNYGALQHPPRPSATDGSPYPPGLASRKAPPSARASP